MAAIRGMLHLLLIIFFMTNTPETKADFTNWQLSTAQFANDLAEALVRLMNRTTEINHLEMIYGDLTGAELKLVSKDHLLKKMAKDVGTMFGERTTALRKLVEKAEHAIKNYKVTSTHRDSYVSFINMKKIDDNDFQFNSIFKNKVNFNRSAVYIPEKVFEKDSSVQNEIKWSAVLDKTFKKNNEMYTGLSWQYFASNTGIMRVYPAAKWRELPEDTLDVYDVRQRSWYIDALTSAKDVLLLADTSGNYFNKQSLNIMKMSLKSLLNTLGENDYINIASFGEITEWISCFHTLVQASSVNKQVLVKAIDRLQDGDKSANYTKALEFAFNELNKFNAAKMPTDGADCHKVIIFFTYEDNQEDLRELYLKENNQTLIRIFIYVVGRDVSNSENRMLEVACNNKGSLSYIPTLDVIQERLLHYIYVLNQPMILSGAKQSKWTTIYNDVMGLGMITTFKLPVYNHSADGSSPSLVGVMGIDTPVTDFENLGPTRQLGPLGYSFTINQNGFVVYHPKTKTEGDFLDDFSRVDLNDLEEDSHLMTQLRRKMIDKEPSSVVVNVMEVTENQKYIYKQEKNYFLTGIVNTPLSLALVFPTDRNYYLKIDSAKFNILTSLGKQKDNGIIAPWRFCDGYPDPSSNATPFDLIKQGKNYNRDMVLHLRWDMLKTKSLPHTWRTQLNKNSIFSEYVKLIFLGTEGGLTRVYSESDLYINKFQQYADTWKAEYYRRATSAKDIWIFSVIEKPDLNGNDSGIIQAVKSVVTREKKTFIPGVVGVQFAVDGIMELILEGNFKDFGFNKPKFVNYEMDQLPCNQKEVICYLLDDGGYTIATSHDNNINKFLGDIDPELMWVLFQNQIYNRKKTYNYQALCSTLQNGLKGGIEANKGATGSAIRNSQLNLGFHCLFDLISWFYMKFSLYSFFQSFWFSSTTADFDFGSVYTEKEPCVTVQHQYYFGQNVSFIGEFSCDACYRKISAVRMQGTNLLFASVDAPCSVSGIVCPHIMHLHQNPERVSSKILCQRKSRYRRKSTSCFAHDDKENASICNSYLNF